MSDSKEVLHTQGELWLDDDGFIAIGKGKDYKTFADLDCSDLDIAEREANKERMILVWNNYQKLLDENKALAELLKLDADKRTIIKALSGRQQLLDSNRELLEALKNVSEDLKNMACNYAGYSFGEGRQNHYSKIASYTEAQTAINNAKNIK